MNAMSKRERLIDSASELFHRSGMSSTSLADIARHADIPIGNVYYYFKTKEELAMAAIEKRKLAMEQAYAQLEEHLEDPRERLVTAVRFFEKVRDDYTRYGCPVGKIIQDGDMERDKVAQGAAEVFDSFVRWAEQQFSQLGYAETSRAHALTLLAGIQGGALMAKAYRNPQIMNDELDRLSLWLESLPNKKIFLGKAGVRSLTDA